MMSMAASLQDLLADYAAIPDSSVDQRMGDQCAGFAGKGAFVVLIIGGFVHGLITRLLGGDGLPGVGIVDLGRPSYRRRCGARGRV